MINIIIHTIYQLPKGELFTCKDICNIVGYKYNAYIATLVQYLSFVCPFYDVLTSTKSGANLYIRL